jgi:hypothetical protein
MAKQPLIINGYKMPRLGSKGRAAIEYACKAILDSPGEKQGDIQEWACRFSGLNSSTAGWIVCPGSKSPALKLWDRQKIGRGYKCFPNEFTELAAGNPDASLMAYKKTQFFKRVNKKFTRGEVVTAITRGRWRVASSGYVYTEEVYTVLGWCALNLGFKANNQTDTSSVFDTPAELWDSGQACDKLALCQVLLPNGAIGYIRHSHDKVWVIQHLVPHV